jgi:hypothetical protein
MLQTRECAPTPCHFAIFTFGFAVGSIQEFVSVSLHEDFKMIFSLPMLADAYATFAMLSLCYA